MAAVAARNMLLLEAARLSATTPSVRQPAGTSSDLPAARRCSVDDEGHPAPSIPMPRKQSRRVGARRVGEAPQHGDELDSSDSARQRHRSSLPQVTTHRWWTAVECRLAIVSGASPCVDAFPGVGTQACSHHRSESEQRWLAEGGCLRVTGSWPVTPERSCNVGREADGLIAGGRDAAGTSSTRVAESSLWSQGDPAADGRDRQREARSRAHRCSAREPSADRPPRSLAGGAVVSGDADVDVAPP